MTATEVKKTMLSQLISSVIMTAIVFPAVILSLAGDGRWVEGWIFSLWMVVMIDSITLYLYLKDPELLAERSRSHAADNQKPWDKVLLNVIYVIALAWLLIMPLDAKRFAWSPAFPLWIKVLGGVILIPALYLIVRPTVDNTFLSTAVRIQTERKQHVISTGTYGFVRHPLYLGCLLMMLGAPLLLGSICGLILSLIGLILIIGRIIGEEKMLAEELEGYEDYKKKVTYRLIPFVW